MTKFNKKTLKVGDKVYVAGAHMYERRDIARWETVSKIGNKYFYTEETEHEWNDIRYDWDGKQIGKWVGDIRTLGPIAYASKEDYQNEIARQEYAWKIHRLYNSKISEHELPMEALQELEAFINKWGK